MYGMDNKSNHVTIQLLNEDQQNLVDVPLDSQRDCSNCWEK